MSALPRIAVGTIQPEADLRAMLWALMEALRESGLQVQGFLSQASFVAFHGAATASGLSPRHLDSWLMSPETCRWLFAQGASCCDLAVVQGSFVPPRAGEDGQGGSLETLCQWLDLPRIVSLDVSAAGGRGLPRPARVDALLLDGVEDAQDLARLSDELESCWEVPVLGGLEALPELRAEVAAVPKGTRPPRELCQRLGSQMLRHMQPQRVMQLASQRKLPWASEPPFDTPWDASSSPLVVALAYDKAINCYFPDTLDLLESRGATVVDFSPLRDERLPPDTDIVYLGCGHPEYHAAELSQNHCMKLALRNHLRRGGRLYAEGGGLAYLCQQMEIGEGELWRMAGVFPATAHLCPNAGLPAPLEVTLDQGTWLAERGARLRGYEIPRWRIQPADGLTGCIAEADHRNILVKNARALGSQLHLHFAVLPDLFSSFLKVDPLGPCPPDPIPPASC